MARHKKHGKSKNLPALDEGSAADAQMKPVIAEVDAGWQRRRAVRRFGLAIVIVAAAGLLLAWFAYSGNREPAKGPACTAQHIKDAKTAIAKKATADLGTVVSDFRKEPSYVDNINCMYILVKYDLMRGHVSQAIRDFERLMAIHDSGRVLDESLSKQTATEMKALSDEVNRESEEEDGVQSRSEDQI